MGSSYLTERYRGIRAVPVILILALAADCCVAQRSAPSPAGCPQFTNTYGPFDYRTAAPGQRSIVENRHFTHGIENLIKNATTDFGGNISYTLNVFPNHARAINTLVRLAEQEKTDRPAGADQSVECYFGRGLAFAPDDLVFRMIYVNYLIRQRRIDEARKSLEYVVAQAGDSALTHFNAGLLYLDMKAYDEALAQAHRIIAMGYDRPELRERLKKADRWQEPPASAEPAASSP
jgi:tetratricopeptide (TPR) repeat protein